MKYNRSPTPSVAEPRRHRRRTRNDRWRRSASWTGARRAAAPGGCSNRRPWCRHFSCQRRQVASAIIASAFHAWHVSRKIAAVASTSTTIFKWSHSRKSWLPRPQSPFGLTSFDESLCRPMLKHSCWPAWNAQN